MNERLNQFLRFLEAEKPEFLSPQLDVMGLVRRLAITNPITAAQELPQKLAQSRQMLEEYTPGQQIDPRLLDQFMGLTGFGSAGVTKLSSKTPTLEEFEKLASSGKMQIAKTKKEELDYLKSGKSKFAELNLNWDSPETYKLVDKLKDQGYEVITHQQGPQLLTYIFKNFDDVRPILNATNQAEFGKAYGYSDADIARFYTERFKEYPKEDVYKMYLQDIQGLLD